MTDCAWPSCVIHKVSSAIGTEPVCSFETFLFNGRVFLLSFGRVDSSKIVHCANIKLGTSHRPRQGTYSEQLIKQASDVVNFVFHWAELCLSVLTFAGVILCT